MHSCSTHDLQSSVMQLRLLRCCAGTVIPLGDASPVGDGDTIGSGDGDATITLKPGQVHPELFRRLSSRQRRGSKAPEAGHIHLTPDTDPESTFRTRQRQSQPRVRFEELQTMFSIDSSNQGAPLANGSSGNHRDKSENTSASNGLIEDASDKV